MTPEQQINDLLKLVRANEKYFDAGFRTEYKLSEENVIPFLIEWLQENIDDFNNVPPLI